MARSRILPVLAALAALPLLVFGAGALKWYAWDIVVLQAGEPDRSMLFWGLPIAFLGLGAMAAGGALAFYAKRGWFGGGPKLGG